MLKPLRVLLPAAALVFLLFGARTASAQCVSLTTLGSPSTQNFDTLATAGTNVAWTDNSTLPGWYSTRTTYNAGNGSSNTGALYSFGVAGANPVTDRALGGVGSGGTGTFYWAVCFVNNTGSSLTSLDISYIGEQWRDGLPVPAAAQSIAFEYQVAAPAVITDADTPASGWTAFTSLDFTGPQTGTAAVALDGNLAANRTAKSASLPVTVAPGNQIWMRWRDLNDASNDHGLAVDGFSATPQSSPTAVLNISDVTLAEGDPAGTTTFTFAVTLTAPTGGGVTFDIATADGTAQDDTPATEDNDYVAQSLTGQSIPGGSTGPYNFSVTVNRDLASEANETFFVNVTNIVGASPGDIQGLGTITNDDVTVVFIHDVQGNGAATPIPGTTVTVEGVVTANFQGASRLSGFFLQEEDVDADADPATSEGIFIFCSACPTAVAEGQRVRATGSVSEFNNLTEITATTAGSVVITNPGNNLAQVTPAPIDLPIAGVVNDFYEAREGMLVTFVDTLTVSEYFELGRFGHIELFEGGRPRQFTETSAPSVAGYAAHLAALDRRRVILDDDNNRQNAYLPAFGGPADGSQFIYHPRANGGFSVGTQGTDFFRGGDLVNGLTGVLHWSFPGVAPDTWRIRPTAATPAAFTVANPRPATPPAVGGAIKAVGMNLLNYFTTIDTTTSTSTGPCAPSATLDCRGADSAAELVRQRARAALVICTLNADVYGFAELENTTPSASINDLLGAVNTLCGAPHPYAAASTGGTLGTDAIRVQQIYRTGILSPVGAPLSDLDPIHSRPPTAQTYDVVDAANPAFGQRFTVVINHFKSKGSSAGLPGDTDIMDGAGASNATRTAQASRLLTWITGTVLPAAGDPDVLLLGDFNAYPKETPVTTLNGGGYTDLEVAFQGANAYSYLFDGQLGHLDYGFASASLLPQVTGSDAWHINADEVDLFDYNDEVFDAGGETNTSFEEKPDGSALVPPRVVFQPGTPYRASDHDPVLVGLFQVADLSITKTDSPDPVTAGGNLTYTITVTNSGPDVAANASWSDTLPAGTTFVSLPAVAGWSCTTGATVSCSNPSFAVGSAVFTLTVAVAPSVTAGSVLSNTATATATTSDPDTADRSATATTTVAASADLSVTKVDTPDPVTAGTNLTYTITVTNAGPSNAASASFSDTLPAGTTFVSLPAVAGWSCTTGATVTCSNPSFAPGSAVFTLTVAVGPSVASGTVLSNTATISAATSDPNPGNESGTATTTVAASANLSVTKVDTPDPVTAGTNLTYTITVTNAGPSNAATVSLSDTLPAGTTFVSLPAVAGWSCTTGATVTCSNPSFAPGSAVFTLTVAVDAGVASGTVLSNTATVSSATTDPSPGNESATATTTVGTGNADLSVTISDFPDPVVAGNNLTYFITVTNAGPSSASSVSLTDTLPAGTTFGSLPAVASWSCTTPAVGAAGTVTCSNPSFAPGSAGFTLTVAVDPSVAAGTVLSDTATVSSTTTDSNPGNESGTTTTTVISAADLSVTKTDSPDPVNPGGSITYTITVANAAGGSNAATVSLSDTLPAETAFVSLASPGGWSCTTPAVGANGTVSCSTASLAAGGSAVFTLTVAVDAGTLAGTVISNTATVSSASSDPNPGNESATATTDVVISSADLSVTKVDTPDPVTPGTNLTYTITVANAGPDAAAAAALSDTLPAGTTFISLSSPGGWSCTTPAVGAGGTVSCSTGSLSVGSAVFTLVVQVDPSVLPGTEITNLASASSSAIDPDPKNDIGIATTTVAGSADLSVTKVGTPDPVAAGADLTYTITVTNAGPNYAGGVALDDPLPAGTTFQSLSAPAGWLCSAPVVGAAGNVSCSIASFAPGSAAFTLVVHVGAGVANGTVLTNTATVSAAMADLNPGNESATATTTVTNLTVISATKTAGGQLTPGGTVTYTVVLSNTSVQDQADNPGAEFTDVLPAELTLVSATATSGTAVATVATNTVTWNGPIPAGSSVTITINATVHTGLAPGTTITNQGSVAYDADGDGINEATAVTDDPAAGGAGNPTIFIVGGQSAVEIPTLNEAGLALLILLLASGGALLLRRRRA